MQGLREKSIDEVSKAVGEVLAQAVAAAMGTSQAARTYTKLSASDRDGNGIKDDEYYGVLHGAKLVRVPGIILEHSFHTNEKAAAWLLVDSNLQAMAAAEAAALAKYYGMEKSQGEAGGQEPEKQPETAAAWYRVRKSWKDAGSQIGAYKVKDNAIKNCPAGYAVYDDKGEAVYINGAEDTNANKWYRVRKSWEDAGSQLGAYRVFDNAINNCPAGYAVFNDNGSVLYRNVAAVEHVVKAGDKLGLIAKKYGTSVDKIVSDNKAKYPQITANYIRVGWKLVIK